MSDEKRFKQSMRKLAARLVELQHCARSLGVFLGDRELLECSHCGLMGDVLCTCQLFTCRSGREGQGNEHESSRLFESCSLLRCLVDIGHAPEQHRRVDVFIGSVRRKNDTARTSPSNHRSLRRSKECSSLEPKGFKPFEDCELHCRSCRTLNRVLAPAA